MTDVQFGRLEDLPLRDAWKHEALSFTPWLALNINHLADAIGVRLELTGQEVRVESFAADILARNIEDDTLVLIENQLEEGDHNHLGQIMTYLAGLEAKTVVWIAQSFRQPHLSAIRWLNEHTADDFSFFAVRLRVVRISDSPLAPIFEILEKPDKWMRQLKSETSVSDLRSLRSSYWDHLENRISDLYPERKGQHLMFPIKGSEVLCVVLEIHRTRAVVMVRSKLTEDPGELREEIQSAAPTIEVRLGPIRETQYGAAFAKSTACDLLVPETWQETMNWHEERVRTYITAFQEPGNT